MKELIILNIGQIGGQIGDHLQEQLAIENTIIDQQLTNKDLEFGVKSFYYETQNNQYVPRTIFLDYENIALKKKLYSKQNFSSIRLMIEKCDALQGLVILHSQDVKQYLQDLDFLPQYYFTIQEDCINYQNQINSLKTYQSLNEMAEVAVTLTDQSNNLPSPTAQRSVASLIANCLVGVNQPFKRMMDITLFSKFLVPDTDFRFLTCGQDTNYINAYDNNYSGINYEEGKFLKSVLIVRGEPQIEGVKSVQELTQNNLYVGQLEKPHPGVTQISNHSLNLQSLKLNMDKVAKIPKKLFTFDYEIDDSLNKLIELYQS